MKALTRACIITIAVTLPLICILGAGVAMSRLPDFYSHEFSTLDSIEAIDVDVTPRDMADLFAGFINGKFDQFQIIAEVNGIEKEVFKPHEHDHMVEVKAVVDMLTVVLVVCLLGFIAATITIGVRVKAKALLRTAYKYAIGVYAGILGLLGLSFLIDFTVPFTIFHKIFFKGDGWLLDPNNDIMLMIMPEKFFLDGAIMALTIATIVFVAFRIVIWNLTQERKMFHIDE